METLSIDLITEITNRLNYETIFPLRTLSKHFDKILSHNQIWIYHIKRYFPTETYNEHTNLMALFIELIEQVREDIQVFIRRTKEGPYTYQEIRLWESKVGFPFSIELVEMYRNHGVCSRYYRPSMLSRREMACVSGGGLEIRFDGNLDFGGVNMRTCLDREGGCWGVFDNGDGVLQVKRMPISFCDVLKFPFLIQSAGFIRQLGFKP
eukprot:TRINITY_DN3808_c0_g1_i1.p1 TRINITY_DN3808_c0_g1~~TRINITY_DN3808_c0_g1_i1.p1  ORF type:complete len:216 (-),score=21.96 TRINITY_DN3808_c0_g1_i1:58-681(-)